MISTVMQQRAGLLFLSLTTNRILLILEDQKWTVPTFQRVSTLLNDAQQLLSDYGGDSARILPIELYQSEDRGFEYGTYVCLVKKEFLPTCVETIAWSSIHNLPKNLHSGLRFTLESPITATKIDTIVKLEGIKNNDTEQ